MTIGATIRRLREQRGMNQAELAEAINRRLDSAARRWNQPLVSQIEIGRTKSPPIAKLEEIAAGLDITLAVLFLEHEAGPAGRAAAVPARVQGQPGARAAADIVRLLVSAHPEATATLARLEEHNDARTYEAAIAALAELAAADIAVAKKLGLIPADR